jgi:hypothetical protein
MLPPEQITGKLLPMETGAGQRTAGIVEVIGGLKRRK